MRWALLLMTLVTACLTSCQSLAPRSWDLPPGVKVLPVNGYDMAYVERGQGAPLVLVHGTLGDFRTWDQVTSSLSDKYHTISVSLRHAYPEHWDGRGDDGSLSQHASDLAVFIRALGLGPVHLLGHSRGGTVVLFTASAHPELMRSVILADPAPLMNMLPKRPDVQAAMDQRTVLIQSMLEHFRKGDVDGGAATWINGIGGPGAWDAASEGARTVWRANAWTAKTLYGDDRLPFACADAAKIKVPVLLVTGDKSPPIYGYVQESLRPCLERVTSVAIPNAGHGMFRANPQVFNERIGEFLAEH
ncbi:alpha/beta fold hydrolase [Ralstonia solanacearum]|uniref:alpha/beta fold hydrolase n=1 Tax=Ralstonia solanacearum TaxID=305 RepID=UPI0001D95A6E|nr:alpha/beta hydrolase [Ralstonia solanacearum]CBJ35488.1 putative hydrolase [Ralstonia solanacearum PSI07]